MTNYKIHSLYPLFVNFEKSYPPPFLNDAYCEVRVGDWVETLSEKNRKGSERKTSAFKLLPNISVKLFESRELI